MNSRRVLGSSLPHRLWVRTSQNPFAMLLGCFQARSSLSTGSPSPLSVLLSAPAHSPSCRTRAGPCALPGATGPKSNGSAEGNRSRVDLEHRKLTSTRDAEFKLGNFSLPTVTESRESSVKEQVRTSPSAAFGSSGPPQKLGGLSDP